MVAFSSLVHLPGCSIDEIRHTASTTILVAHTVSHHKPCPSCGSISHRVHSCYIRTPRDLPVGQFPVCLVIHVRRFFCDARDCPCRTFAERLDEFPPVNAQRTQRLTRALQILGFATGGEAGASIGRQLGFPISPDTILRVVHQTSLPTTPTPRVLGVDDFAFRKRHTYGTVLVDLERHRPIDMLPDRSAETFARWLRAHPGVEVIARDRSTEYARGARDGAPNALQVADRWHLLQNMRDALERTITTLLPRLRQRLSQAPSHTSELSRLRLKPYSTEEVARRDQSREARYARYLHVKHLKTQGLSNREIANQLKTSRAVVIRFVQSPQFPERAAQRTRPSRLDPYMTYLQERWDAGCSNSSQFDFIHWEALRGVGKRICEAFNQRPW